MGDNIGEYSMHVHFELPEDIAQAMIAGGRDLTREAEQSIALEGYRSGRLSEEQVAVCWDLSRCYRFIPF